MASEHRESKCHYFHFFHGFFIWLTRASLYWQHVWQHIDFIPKTNASIFLYDIQIGTNNNHLFIWIFCYCCLIANSVVYISNEYHQFLKIQIISIAFSWKTKSWFIKSLISYLFNQNDYNFRNIIIDWKCKKMEKPTEYILNVLKCTKKSL